MADPNKTPAVFNFSTNGPPKYLPTAIKPVTNAKISIGLAPALASIGPTHCCGPNSEIAVNAMQHATKMYNGFNIALKLAKENDIISTVVAFSPGEYFGSLVSIKESIAGLDIPIFVTCSADEVPYVKELVSGITSNKLVTYYPTTGGKHGAAALFKDNPNNQAYWINLLGFMQSLKKK